MARKRAGKSRGANPFREYTRATYPAIFGDTDEDQIPDVDDPHPFEPGDTTSIEEVLLSDEIGEFIDARGTYVPATRDVMERLEAIGIPGSKVEGRVKSPFSLINKLRRKRMGTLTDISGTRIIVPDQASVDVVSGVVEGDFEILEKDDYYAQPQAGYRALHYIVRAHGLPVEVQIKTDRMSKISEAAHTPYKRGTLDAAAMDRLTDLAARADAGDRRAAKEVDPMLKDAARLQKTLTKEPNPRVRRMARRAANGGRG